MLLCKNKRICKDDETLDSIQSSFMKWRAIHWKEENPTAARGFNKIMNNIFLMTFINLAIENTQTKYDVEIFWNNFFCSSPLKGIAACLSKTPASNAQIERVFSIRSLIQNQRLRASLLPENVSNYL